MYALGNDSVPMSWILLLRSMHCSKLLLMRTRFVMHRKRRRCGWCSMRRWSTRSCTAISTMHRRRRAFARMRTLAARYPSGRSAVLPSLYIAQEEEGYITQEGLQAELPVVRADAGVAGDTPPASRVGRGIAAGPEAGNPKSEVRNPKQIPNAEIEMTQTRRRGAFGSFYQSSS